MPTPHNTSPRRIAAREREARAIELRKGGATLRQIAGEIGVASEGVVHNIIRRGMARLPEEQAVELRAMAVEQLRDLYRRTIEILNRPHPLVSHGKIMFVRDLAGEIVRDAEGHAIPLDDDRIKLAAIAELRNLQESTRRLLGVDAPVRHRVDFVPSDVLRSELEDTRRLIEEAERALSGA